MTKISEYKKIFSWNFSILTFGNLTSKIGTVIYNVILTWWIVEKTNSAKPIGYITAAAMIPGIIFNIFSGVIVDKFNKKKLLVLSDFLSAITCVTVSIIIKNGSVNIPVLILSSFLLGVSESLFTPCVKSIVPDIIEKKYIVQSNSITSTFSQVIKIVAPIVAGILYTKTSLTVAGVFFLNGITFFISALSEALIIYKPIAKKNESKFLIKDFKLGLMYLKGTEWLIKLLMASALVNIFIAAYNVLLPLFLKTAFVDGGMVYGKALSYEAIGSIIGAITLNLFKKKKSIFSLGTEILLCGICTIGIQFTFNQYVTLMFVLLFGLFLTRFNIMFFSLVQINVNKEMLGRVFSLIFMTSLSLMPISNLIFGFLGDYIIKYIYFFTGGGIALTSILIFKIDEDSLPKVLDNNM